MDRYTKAVLTVIAAALCALVAQNATGPLQAQSKPPVQRVVICDFDGSNCAAVLGDGSRWGSMDSRGSLAIEGRVGMK